MRAFFKRWTCTILTILLLSGTVPVLAFASGNQSFVPTGQNVGEKTYTCEMIPRVLLPSNRRLFAEYIEQMLYGTKASTYGTAGRGRLNSAERAIYDALKQKIEEVAQNGGSTEFYFGSIDGLQGAWPKSEYPTQESVENSYFDSAGTAIDALLEDCPFDLYWYDKTAYTRMSFQLGSSDTAWKPYNFKFIFPVSSDFASGTNYVSKDVARVNTAKNNAAKVVSANSGKSPYGKMVAYKNYICDSVAYDSAAADNENTPYGDPWQLISVFDGDRTTNVVCEGYSKAFQYLCDLSGLQCTVATGLMNGGRHMWNVATLDGKK